MISLFFNNGYAQRSRARLVGVWQVNSSTMADAWNSNYRFYNDGTFKYTFNQYDDRGRIRAAKGTYTLKGDTLTLKIKTRTERVGGDLVGGSPGFQQEEIVLDGGKTIEVKQKNTDPIELTIEWFTRKGVKGFKVQNNKYYLISKDPRYQDS